MKTHTKSQYVVLLCLILLAIEALQAFYFLHMGNVSTTRLITAGMASTLVIALVIKFIARNKQKV